LRRALGKTERDESERGGTRLEMLERRLDNGVFRLGWAQSIPAARQLVGHGRVRVNGRRVDRPGYTVKSGDELALANGMIDSPKHPLKAEVKSKVHVQRSSARSLTGAGAVGGLDARRAGGYALAGKDERNIGVRKI
jgi:ribosomal protein S4